MIYAKNILKNKPLIIIAVSIAFLLAVVTMYLLFQDKDVLAKVGSTKITKKDLNEQIYSEDFSGSIDEPVDVSKEEKEKLLDRLIEWEVTRQKAENDGIKVTDEELDKYIKENLLKFDEYTDVQKELTKKSSRSSLLRQKVEESVLGWKEGGYILVRYDKNFDSDIALSPEQKAKEDIGREQRIKEDTDYAKSLVDSIYSDIKSGKITFEQGMEKAKNDPKVGVEGYKPMTVLQSDSFDKKDYIDGQKVFSFDEFKGKIDNLTVDELSQPFALKVADANGEKEEKDGIWAIAVVKSSQETENPSYTDWLRKEIERLKVKIYKNRIASMLTPWVGGKAYALSANDCGSISRYGVNTGNTNSTAGLVVKTSSYNSAGAFVSFFNTTVTVSSQSVDGGGGILFTPNGRSAAYSGGTTVKNFTTGDGFFKDGYGVTTCSATGHLVLGYGNTSGTREGHFGNGFTLGCRANSFVATVPNAGPGKYGGYWIGGESWNPQSKIINVTNGSTRWHEFKWYRNPNSAPTAYHSAPSNGDVIAAGTASYVLRGKGDDPNNETVRLRTRYRSRATDGGSFGTGWTATTDYTGLVSDNTASNIFNLPLANGRTYEWQVQAKDSAGLEGGWTGSWYFSVNAPPTASHVYPAHGASFAVGTPAVMLRGIGHDPSNNQIQLRIQYRSRVTAGGVFGGWTANAYSALAGDDSNRDIYNLPVSNGRTYEWQVQAKDGRGAEGPWSGSRSFSISPQSLSVTLERTDTQSNTTDLLRPSLKATATSAGIPTTATYNWIFQRKRSTDASYTECDRYNAADATQNTKTTDRCSFEGTYPATTYNVRVLVERGSLQAYSSPLNITVARPHIISCNALTAAPSGGTLPLTVTFTAGVVDSWNHAITYLWDFSYDGTTFNSERQTSSNQTSYTFTTNGSQKVAVQGISDISTPISGCPSTVEFNVNPWSSGDQNEVAP